MHLKQQKVDTSRGPRGLFTDLVQPTIGRNDLILLVLKQHQHSASDAEKFISVQVAAAADVAIFSWQLRDS